MSFQTIADIQQCPERKRRVGAQKRFCDSQKELKMKEGKAKT